MGEISLEASTVSRFIISLSKSIQALCHGCMDFDDSIEMIGYININIDSGKTVDCVLNEKVRKSAANSMTCISNSFQAKKEKPKQTKDSSCSPIQPSEYSSHYSPNKRQYSEHFQRGPVRKKHRYHSKPALPYSEQYSTSGNAYNEQSDTTSSEFTNPQQTVKTEVPGGDSSFFDISSSTSSQNFLVKQEQMDLPVSQTDAEDQGVSDKNEDSIETGGEESFKFNVDKDPPSNVAEQSHERTENAPPKFEHDQENQKQFGNAEVGAESSFLGSEDVQDMHISQDQQPHGSREETSEDAQFEVIEIGDDDEDMHGIFDQTGTQRMMGHYHHQNHHLMATGAPHPCTTNRSFLSLPGYLEQRERKHFLAKVNRQNRTSEQKERDRWLAKMRQRRRRARLRDRMFEQPEQEES